MKWYWILLLILAGISIGVIGCLAVFYHSFKDMWR